MAATVSATSAAQNQPCRSVGALTGRTYAGTAATSPATAADRRTSSCSILLMMLTLLGRPRQRTRPRPPAARLHRGWCVDTRRAQVPPLDAPAALAVNQEQRFVREDIDQPGHT